MPQRVITEIRGVRFPSQAEAARAFRVSPKTVWKAAEHGWLDGIGTGGRHVPVIIDGIRYPSMADAGKSLGISRQAVASRLQHRTAQRAQEAAA